MKKVVVKSHNQLQAVDGKSNICVCEDSFFEGNDIRIINTNDGLLIVEDSDSKNIWEIAVFNRCEWIYWKKLE
jgi:hypothetical protein